MNSPGTVAEAKALAIERWAKLHPFDLDMATWDELFTRYRPGEVLRAVQKTAHTHDKRIENVYQTLLYWLRLLESDRLSHNVWPPPDCNPNN